MNKLKPYRLDRGWTQQTLAELSEVPRAFIQGLEAGLKQRNEDYQKRLAKALGVAVKVLFPNFEKFHQ